MKLIKQTDFLQIAQLRTYRKKPICILAIEMEEPFKVETKEGTMKGKEGDFLIRGIEGELYPCDRSIFFKTYELVADEEEQ